MIADLATGAGGGASRAAGIDVLVANAALPGTGRLTSFTAGSDRPRARRQPARSDAAHARAAAGDARARTRPHRADVVPGGQGRDRRASSIYCATKFGLRGFGFSLNDELRGTGRRGDDRVPRLRPRGWPVRGQRREAAARRRHELAAGGRRRGLQGIERNRAEIDVAPLAMRSGAQAVRRGARAWSPRSSRARRRTGIAASGGRGSARLSAECSCSSHLRDRLPREGADQLARAARAGPRARTCRSPSIRSRRAFGNSRRAAPRSST